MSYKQYILVCGGTACDSIRGMELFNALKTAVKENGLINEVQVVRTGCLGFCEKGPIVKVLPQDTFYVEVKPEDAEEIIKEHIIKGREVSRLLYDKNRARSTSPSKASISTRSSSALCCATAARSIRM